MTELARRETSTAVAKRGLEIAPDESLPQAMRRISIGLFDGAISDLRPADRAKLDRGVHQARKKMKRLRAVLRLLRGTVGDKSYRDENAVLRDTARSLSGVRDAWVQIETLRDLRARYQDLLGQSTFATTDAWLQRNHAVRHSSVSEQTLTTAIVNLAASRSRFVAYAFDQAIGDSYQAVAPGIARVYDRGYRGCRRAGPGSSPEQLHDWRKRVKYLRYQMEYLAPLQPVLIGSMAAELERLGEILGADHDLVVLARTISANPDACPDDRERWVLMSLIFEKRAWLHDLANRLGTALYAEEPDAFVDRIGSYWRAVRA